MINHSEALKKLIELTATSALTWDDYQPIARDNVVGKVYTADYGGARLALYESKYKYFTDEDTFEWLNRTNLEIVDTMGRLAWAWPEMKEIDALLEEVRFTTAGVRSFYDHLLSK